ncbi:MAG: hypothetical protein ACLFPJ_00665 [Candidatus Woesearchaeota archaeon]
MVFSCCKYKKGCYFLSLFYKSKKNKKNLREFVIFYCNENYNFCFRKKIADIVGLERVPFNLLANGTIFENTTILSWSESVKKIFYKVYFNIENNIDNKITSKCDNKFLLSRFDNLIIKKKEVF